MRFINSCFAFMNSSNAPTGLLKIYENKLYLIVSYMYILKFQNKALNAT